MRIAFGGGGTGGHVIPALAVALELRHLGHDAFFIGNSKSVEEKLSIMHGFMFHPIKVRKLYRANYLHNALFPYYLVHSIITCISILAKNKPDAVFCTGGFVSGPLALAALLLRIPLFGHESNSYPGLVTRTLARHYTRIFISFEASRIYLHNAKIANHGIPILAKNISTFSLESTGLNPGKPILLVSGGSQGSLAINQAVDKALAQILELGYQVIWQTGSVSYTQYQNRYSGQSGLYLFDFSPELPAMLSYVDIAITRAGALTIAELENNHIPVILIPLPTAAENHQYHNALAQEKKGVAYMLEQSKLDAGTLVNAINKVKNDRELYREAFMSLKHNDASSDIARDMLEVLKPGT